MIKIFPLNNQSKEKRQKKTRKGEGKVKVRGMITFNFDDSRLERKKSEKRFPHISYKSWKISF